ncbi:DUF4340 domain-containing protein [Alphaproteobacteria bacterium]|nr:DUF4340 domain-containing protein [Alphaproteobacteria bacterium]
MTKKSFLNLSILSFLSITLAAVSINFNSQTYNFSDRDSVFLKNFTKNVNDITLISINSFDNNIDLVKDENSYISSSGYPLKKGIWENLITSLSLLTIEEKKTNDPKRHVELNLLLPELNKSDIESEGYATKITLTKKDGSIFSSILFGKTDPSVGGLSGGQFARMPDDNQSFLLKGAIRMPTSKSDWFESLLFTIQNKNFQSALLQRKKQIFKIEDIQNSLKLTFPKNITLDVDETKLNDVREIINGFYFYDVKKSSNIKFDSISTLTFETKDGLVLLLSTNDPSKKGEIWITIKAIPKNNKVKKLSEDINQKTKGFEFLANINTSDMLRWNLNSLKQTNKNK